MVLSRLFFWSAFVAGLMLIVAIVMLIISASNKSIPQGLSTAAAETYHPGEAFVSQLNQVDCYQQKITFNGRLVPKHQSELAFEQGGLVIQMWVDLGQTVQKGQAIAKLDTQLLDLQVKQAQAEVAAAAATLAEMRSGPRTTTLAASKADLEATEAELENLERQFERQSELARKGAISVNELDSVTAGVTASRKRLRAVRQRVAELEEGTRQEQIDAQLALGDGLTARLQQLETQVTKSTLLAPYDGYIAQTLADLGNVLAGGQPIVQLIQAKPIEAHVGVSLAVSEQLRIGQEYQLLCDQQSVPAKLDRMVPALDPGLQTVLAIFSIDEVKQVKQVKQAELGKRVAVEAPPRQIAVSNKNANDQLVVSQDSLGGAVGQTRNDRLFPGRSVSLVWEATIQEAGFWLPNDAMCRGRRGLWNVFEFYPDSIPEWEAATVKSAAKHDGNALNIKSILNIEEVANLAVAAGKSGNVDLNVENSGSANVAWEENLPPRHLGVVKKQQVEVLYTCGEQSFVRGSIQDQHWIVSEGSQRLLDGQRVQVVDQGLLAQAAAVE